MDVWEKQLSAPTSDQFMAQLRKFPGAGFGAMPMSSPFDLWMQTTEMWQHNGRRRCRCGPILDRHAITEARKLVD